MAAQNLIKTGNAKTWVEATDGTPAGPVTIQNRGAMALSVVAATTQPSGGHAGLSIDMGFGQMGRTIAEMFPGAAAGSKLWVYSDKPVKVFISHAA